MAIGDALGGIGGAVGGLLGWGLGSRYDAEAQKKLARAYALYETMQLPDFDMRQLSPDDLQIVAEYMPEFYQFVSPGAAPTTVEEGPEGRAAQLSALDYYDQVRREGLPTLERIAAQQAQGAMGQQAQRDRQMALQQAQLMGRGGGGMPLQAMLAGGQQSADLARGFGDQLAQQAVLNRLGAASQGAQLGGQLRGQDIQKSALNADIWNRFNEFVSQGLTEANRYAAGARQAASDKNVSEAQRVADTNAQLRNQYDQRNQEYLNQLRQSQFGNRFQQVGGMTGSLGQQADLDLARGSALNESLYQTGKGLGTAAGGLVGTTDQYEQLRKLLAGLKG